MARRLLTIFTWGYWGWGTATREFVRAVDAVEESRGYKPPLFVDIRIRRIVRAPGFNGSAFERVVGRERYVWMRDLGNRAILQGGRQRILKPSAAADLLAVAQRAALDRRRVVFFCACPVPAECHRRTVAGLVLRAAERTNQKTQIVEWPGREPRWNVRVNMRRRQAGGDRMSTAAFVRLGSRPDLGEIGGVPWYSLAQLESGSTVGGRFLTGPALYDRRYGWLLPRLEDIADGVNRDSIRQLAARRRRAGGYEPRLA